MDSVVQRLHRALAEALQRRRPDIEAAPVTVAEVYQELVPYRSVRSTVGFEMNADYEHALLRLLAGEGALVRLEPEEVRQQLERELTTPNPDVTLFRQFAGCDVWISAPVPAGGASEDTSAAVAPRAGEPGPGGGAEEDWTPAWLEAAAREIIEQPGARRAWLVQDEDEAPARAAAPPPPPPEPPQPQPEPATAAPPPWTEPASPQPGLEREMPRAEAGRAGAHCAFCHTALPLDRPVRYCPYCGVDQQLRPCARCGEILEPGWRYCVSCGAPSPAGAA